MFNSIDPSPLFCVEQGERTRIASGALVANEEVHCPSDLSEGKMRSELADAAPAVRRYLFGMCGSWECSEEVAQEALMKAWARRESFDGRAHIRTWVFAIARNAWRDRLRRTRTHPREMTMTQEPTLLSNEPPPHAAAARVELRAAVRSAMDELPPEQREALAMRESEGLTFSQIAELLDVPLPTVKSRVRYALEKLARSLEPYRGELEK